MKNYNAWNLILTAFLLFVSTTALITGLGYLIYGQEMLSGLWIAVGYTLPMAATVFLVLKIFKLKLFRQPHHLKITDFFLITLAYLPLLFTVEILTSFLPDPSDKLQFLIDLIREEPFWSFLTIVIAAPVLEELLFRRIILHFLLKKYRPLTAIGLSSLAFALFHLNVWQGIGAFIMGMYLGYVYWRTRSLGMVIFLHFLTNFLGFYGIYATEDLQSGMENIPVLTRLGMLVVFGGVFYIVFRYLHQYLRHIPQIIYLATNNPHKVEEIRKILPSGKELKTLRDLGHKNKLHETGNTLEANSLEKAAQIAYRYGVDVIADDTGLETEALDGLPGVKSARFAGKNATDAENRGLLLEKLKEKENRNARFRTVITFIKGNEVHQFEGQIAGSILDEERGEGGFGYDPIFLPEGYEHTFAEMPAEEKNLISHRARALEKLKKSMETIDENI